MGHLTFDSGPVNYLGMSDRLGPPPPLAPARDATTFDA